MICKRDFIDDDELTKKQQSILRLYGEETLALHLFVERMRSYEPELVQLIRQLWGHRYKRYTLSDNGERCVVLSLDTIPTLRIPFFLSQHSFIKTVTLPNSLTHLNQFAFCRCVTLTYVTLPDSLTHLGDKAFFGCTSLMSVTLPNSLTHVGYGAFYTCASLVKVTLSNSLTHLGAKAFLGCTSLTSITLPNSLTHIGDGAFEYCLYLTSVTLPNSLTHIGERVFYMCRWQPGRALSLPSS